MRPAARVDIVIAAAFVSAVVGGYLTMALLAEAFGCGHDGDLSESHCAGGETPSAVLTSVGPLVWIAAVGAAYRWRSWVALLVGVVALVAVAAATGFFPGMSRGL